MRRTMFSTITTAPSTTMPKSSAPKREQVGRDMHQVKTDGGKEKRERDGQCDDQGATRVAEKEEKDDHHQDDPLRQVIEHRTCRELEQIAAIEEGLDSDALGQDVFVQLLDLGADAGDGRVGIVALLQQDDTLDDVRVIDDLAIFAVDGPADLAETDLRALDHSSDVPHPQRCAILRLENGVLDVGNIREETDLAHIDLLLTGLDETAAGIGIVVRQLLLDVADGQAIGDELVRVDADLVFTRDAAKARDIDHAGNLLELLLQLPVLDRLELHVVVGRIGALERVPVDLADWTPVRADLRLQTLWERDL